MPRFEARGGPPPHSTRGRWPGVLSEGRVTERSSRAGFCLATPQADGHYGLISMPSLFAKTSSLPLYFPVCVILLPF